MSKSETEFRVYLKFFGKVPFEDLDRELKLTPVEAHRQGHKRISSSGKVLDSVYSNDVWIWSMDFTRIEEADSILFSTANMLLAVPVVMERSKQFSIELYIVQVYSVRPKGFLNFQFGLTPRTIDALNKSGAELFIDTYVSGWNDQK